MKVLFLMRYGNLGGTERSALEIYRGLRAAGHDCSMIFLCRVKGIGPFLAAEKIEYTQMHRKNSFTDFRALRKLVQGHGPDALVQVGNRFYATAVAWSLPISKKIYMSHHYHKGEKSALVWRLSLAVIRRVYTSVVFSSRWLRAEATRLYPAIAENSCVIYPTVRIQALTTGPTQRSARESLDLPLHSKIIGGAGRLMPAKRFDVFLRVASKVAREIRNAHFVIAGAGPDKGRLKRLAEELGLHDRLTWLPWQDEMEHFYRSLDVFLFNSDVDAFGLVPCEAAAYGIPAVCSILEGGLPEVMPGRNGYILSSHDESKLVRAIVSLCSNPDPAYLNEFRQAIDNHCNPARTMEDFLHLIIDRPSTLSSPA